MKKLPGYVLIFLILTGCGNNIDRVKNGVMSFNKTTTVGKALDNWKSCTTSEWTEFETESGIKVVEFSCNKETDQFMNKLKSTLIEFKFIDDDIAKYMDLTSISTVFQFTINKDKSFQLDGVYSEYNWADGLILVTEGENPVQSLKDAYKNEPALDFDTNRAEDVVAQEAMILRDMFLVLKRRAMDTSSRK